MLVLSMDVAKPKAGTGDRSKMPDSPTDVIITTADGQTITLRLLDVRQGRCRIGIDAPRTVKINRRSVQEMQEQQE